MKKWLIALIILLIVAVIAIYAFIPDTIRLSRAVSFPANVHGARRMLFNAKNWAQWWPGDKPAATADPAVSYSYNGRQYAVDSRQQISLSIPVSGNGVTARTALTIVPLSGDSLKFSWEGRMITSYNPIKRLLSWYKSKEVRVDMDTILNKIQSYLLDPEHIYGLYIRQEMVTDSFLVSTTGVSKGYPDTRFVYSLIKQLKAHIGIHSGKVTGYPMMNVSTADSLNFTTMVAIPVDKALPVSSGIVNKKMMTGAKILTSEVMGGQTSVNAAFRQVEIFVSDYQITAPAIPFFSLITDRGQVADTSRWVTKIYFPIM